MPCDCTEPTRSGRIVTALTSKELTAGSAEPILEPELPIVDPHHHLWPEGPTSVSLPGPGQRATPGEKYVDATPYSVKDLRADAHRGHNVVATVFVECSSKYVEDGPSHLRPVGETRWVAGQSAGDGLLSGIVGFANLMWGPGELADALDAHVEAGDGAFKGVRHTVAWDPDPNVFATPRRPPGGLLLDGGFRRGASELMRRGLVYETWTYFHQLPELRDFAGAHPDLIVVLDHLGGPAATGRHVPHRDEVLAEWRSNIAALADVPNVVLKLGAVGMPAFTPVEFIETTPVTSTGIADYWGADIRHCIDALGPDRCMFESNFPVDRRLCDYATLWNAFKLISASYSAAERELLFSGTARQTYRI